MSRQVAWRRTVSDNVSWRQDQANNATIYILREFGPMGFLLKEEGETKNFKVTHFAQNGNVNSENNNNLFTKIRVGSFQASDPKYSNF